MSDARAPKGAGKVMELGDKRMKVWLAWPGFALVIILMALAGCGSNNSTTASIAISPTAATILLNTSLQFIPNVTGSSNAIQWSVNGIANGNATVGTISSTGLYTAPSTRPVSASAVAVPIIFAAANASLPNSGSAGSVIELQSGFDFTNYAPGNTINISGGSVAGWDGSFLIIFSAALPNGNFGVQIVTPSGPPANGVGGTATATPNITISAQVQSTNAIATATITLDSGIRVSVNQPTCSIGTNETFPFTAVASGTSSQTFAWSLTGVGTIDPNSGLYTAPAATGTATITATSTVDPTESASATVTVVTAADPTVSSVSPRTGALGAAFQDVFLTGSNFICTTGVLVNNTPLLAGSLFSLSSTSFLVVLPDSVLSSLVPIPPATTTVTLTFTVKRQAGAPQPCPNSASCQVVLSPVRPAVVGITPDSAPLSGGSTPVTIDGGYFGTTNSSAGFQGSPVVHLQFGGAPVATPTFSNSDRELGLSVPPTSTSGPGLYPITVANTVTCPTIGPGCGAGSPNGGLAAVNLAVQPSSPPAPVTPGTPMLNVGTTPSSVAIDTAMGIAVVANKGSNDITILNVGTPSAPSLSASATPSLCTGSLVPSPAPCSVTTAPTSVAVDNIRHFALVANSGNNALAVVNLNGSPTVTALLRFPSADPSGLMPSFPLDPQAVAINPVSRRALVAFTTIGPNGSNAAAILDMDQLETTVGSVTLPPAVLTVVNVNNGVNPHIAVSPPLNWALATPGGAGSLSIVDLGRQTTNAITAVSCSANVVTVTTKTAPSLQAGRPVLITGVASANFNGIFSTSAVSNTGFTFEQLGCSGGSSGGTAAYANPVASVATNLNVRGVSINDETQKALLVDPTNLVPAFIFNILDQTSAAVNGLSQTTHNVASAMNPLTNVGVIVNSQSNQLLAVDPVTPTQISSFSGNPLNSPIDVAIDFAANTALVINQGTNSAALFSLGTPSAQLRSGAPQIVQSSFSSVGSTQNSSRVTTSSTLSSAAVAPDQTVTLVGTFPSGSVPRLDGDTSPFSGVTISNGRMMTATLSGSALATNGPRMYTLDVQNSSGISNAAPLQVVQAVSLVTSACSNPAPQGVAIDATHNVAVVTEPGCNPSGAGDVSLINLTNDPAAGLHIGTGFGGNPTLAVGNNPQGVGVYPQAGLAVVANSGSNTVSVVDVLNDDVATSFTVDPIPSGVAINQGTGNAVVTASGASLVDTFPVSTSSQTPATIGVVQGPTGVAIDPKNDVAVVADTSSSRASIVALSTSTTTNTNSITLPQGVAFDPITDSFLITSFATNQVTILNPNSVSIPAIRVGIDPSSIAYNYESGTLVTANNLSGTMTVVDFIDQTVRGLFSLPSSTQYAVDIHLQTNLVVVADTVDNQLLLVPLPH